jgi:uncharacterized protein YegJ (DUF2314 family)
MKNTILLFICALFVLTANAQSVPGKNDPKAIAAVKATAQSQIQSFINDVNTNGHDVVNYRFMVKSDIVRNGIDEHLWVRVLSYKDGSFKGVFIQSPFKLKGIKVGDKITIASDKVEDWSAYNTHTDKTVGDFTLKYMQDKSKVRAK